jgi:hypothetical protein
MYFPDENGYRVMSIYGHILSKKPLTYEKALAQMRAVGLKEHLIGGYENKPSWYLEQARMKAHDNGYDPGSLMWADDGIHKLMMKDDKGKYRYFGKAGYKDYIIYRKLEDMGKVEMGMAEKMRQRYHASHTKIKGKWRDDPYSPNMLSLKINW